MLIKDQLSVQEKGNRQNEITPVYLKNITVPMLNIIASKDDLVSPNSSIPISKVVVSKDIKTIEFPSEHIELCISYDAHQNLWPEVVEWLQGKSSQIQGKLENMLQN